MIAKLTGTVDSTGPNWAIIDVNGVGYMVYASSRTLGHIGGEKGRPAVLFIETVVREDQFTLYGFSQAVEKEWFQILCTVQGVGAKSALSILSAVAAERLPVVIAAGDKAALRQADGVGEKLAVRLVTELKEKAGKLALGHAAQIKAEAAVASGGKKAGPIVDLPAMVSNDAVSALINLGYGRAEAFSAVTDVLSRKGDAVPLGDLIRESLKGLSA